MKRVLDRKKLLYWGTIALIAFFFIEFFWPLMYSNDEIAVTPTPTPQTQFLGGALVNAKIIYFGNDALAYCNGSSSLFKSALESVEGVYGVIGPSGGDEFSFKINASALNSSANESALNASFPNASESNASSVDSIVQRVAGLAASLCGEGSNVLRRAGLQLEDGVISFQSASAMNDFRNVSAQEVSNAFRSRMRSSDVEGFVLGDNAVNSTVPVLITVRLDGTELNSLDPFPLPIKQYLYSDELVGQILGETR